MRRLGETLDRIDAFDIAGTRGQQQRSNNARTGPFAFRTHIQHDGAFA